MKFWYILTSSIVMLCNLDINGSDTLIVDNSKIWSVVYGSYPPYGQSHTTILYKFDGDTIINDTSYYNVLMSYDTTNTNWSHTGQFIRQDSKKVFIRDYDTDRLIYDFNLNLEDTITQMTTRDEEIEWVVQSIDSISLTDNWYKRITFGYLDCASCPIDVWIEGIGSLYGVVTPGNVIIDESTELLCVKKGENYIYTNPNYNSCYVYTDINHKTEVAEFIFYPNPFTDYINIDSGFQEYRYNIYSLQGQVLVSGYSSSNKTLDLKNLKSGLYLLRLSAHSYTKDFIIIKK